VGATSARDRELASSPLAPMGPLAQFWRKTLSARLTLLRLDFRLSVAAGGKGVALEILSRRVALGKSPPATTDKVPPLSLPSAMMQRRKWPAWAWGAGRTSSFAPARAGEVSPARETRQRREEEGTGKKSWRRKVRFYFFSAFLPSPILASYVFPPYWLSSSSRPPIQLVLLPNRCVGRSGSREGDLGEEVREGRASAKFMP